MLVILEMANNHRGSVARGVKIIESLAPLVGEFKDMTLAVKFQYRDPSILHPTLTSKMTERVRSTMLSESNRLRLRNWAKTHGFQIGCTPFDEASAGMVKEHLYDFVKVASCSLTDWPLLERVATLGLPTVASTGGADLEDVDRAATFLARRVPTLTLMHCVSMYPTYIEHLGMDRMDALKEIGLPAGFSTHETGDQVRGVQSAVAKGCRTLEWHVDLADVGNEYSLTVDQTRRRLQAIRDTLVACTLRVNVGERRKLLSLQRGVFAARDLEAGELLAANNVRFQLPAQDGQLLANDWGKYTSYRIQCGVAAGQPLLVDNLVINGTHGLVKANADKVVAILKQSNVTLPKPAKLILSHHHGLGRFSSIGCGAVNCINEPAGYCKKLLVLLPGQTHPMHRHARKSETFHVLWGDALFTVEGQKYPRCAGGMLTVNPGCWHAFHSAGGAVIEEVSTLDEGESEYMEPVTVGRKTEVWLP